MAEIIDGRTVAGEIAARVKELTAELIKESGVTPGLAVVIVGEDPASQVYVAAKSRKAEDCGFHSVQHTLPAGTTQDELVALVEALNADPAVHGILVQFPVPPHIDQQVITQTISPDKDVDGLHVVNIGRLAGGLPGFVPCTPAGAMILAERRHGRDLSGLSAVVIGRSNLVGKPLAALFTAANATVTTAHSKTKDLPAVARGADILVAAVGRPEMVKADWIKPGATVLDIGINRVPAPEKGKNAKGEDQFKLAGDVAFDEALAVAGAVTPVPGGIGPMTIAMLMANTLISAFRAAGREAPKF